jgi:hypothetical protein
MYLQNTSRQRQLCLLTLLVVSTSAPDTIADSADSWFLGDVSPVMIGVFDKSGIHYLCGDRRDV